jgi:phage tail sheath protein FI
MAMDAVSDPEVAEFDTMLCPGMTNSSLNSHMMRICEDRGDALAIVDVAGGYQPDTESTESEAARLGSVDTTVSNLLDYGWNTSYACAYYPWVQIRDNINGSTLWCPPSVAALGTMSFGQKSSELWFAPAGFTRGGLSDGAAGIPVVGVRQRLTSKERDKLYEANVNPIATFPAEGIVIFGQKTLQVTPSALDRINVRRLLIYLKKQVSRMAATILFDQNVKVTWNRFRSEVEPFLRSVQSRLGLTDWKVILDESTTTPDLIDRNIMYAKIFLKPAQAIEFIALDFVITNSGASFED